MGRFPFWAFEGRIRDVSSQEMSHSEGNEANEMSGNSNLSSSHKNSLVSQLRRNSNAPNPKNEFL